MMPLKEGGIILMRRSNRRRRKNKMGIAVAFLVVLLLSYIVIEIVKQKEDGQAQSQTTTVSTNGIAGSQQDKTKNQAKIEDWELLLVNKDNYLPKDYTIELKKVENGYQVDARIADAVLQMLNDARKEDLHPWICSAYRSSATQNKLFNKKIDFYQKQGNSEQEAREKASQWIAIPGTSEHEAGLSLDIVSKSYQLLDKKQENTPEQKWLMEHCYEYGFVMRYPTEKKEITKIDYEPWHYRYVGIENAKIMKENNFCLEEYIAYLKQQN